MLHSHLKTDTNANKEGHFGDKILMAMEVQKNMHNKNVLMLNRTNPNLKFVNLQNNVRTTDAQSTYKSNK